MTTHTVLVNIGELTCWFSQLEDDKFIIHCSDLEILNELTSNNYSLCLSHSLGGKMNVASISMPAKGKANQVQVASVGC